MKVGHIINVLANKQVGGGGGGNKSQEHTEHRSRSRCKIITLVVDTFNSDSYGYPYLEMSKVAFSPTCIWVTPSSQPSHSMF